jgi:hypothetical protein
MQKYLHKHIGKVKNAIMRDYLTNTLFGKTSENKDVCQNQRIWIDRAFF